MVAMTSILELRDRIVEEFQPQRIILFGSHASENPHPDSDVDLLVILPFEGRTVYKALEILNTIDPRIPIDLLARTPQQIQERLDANDFFIQDIVETGKVLYEAPDK